MGIKIENYAEGFKYVSLALDEQTKKDLIEDELDFIFFDKKELFLFPSRIKLEINEDGICELLHHNNYDVYEIWPDGRMYLRYDTTSVDNYFFVTGKCNSNCIMCPSPDYTRKNGDETNIENLITLAKHIPSDSPHLTITGGEPFLSGEEIFKFIFYVKNSIKQNFCF